MLTARSRFFDLLPSAATLIAVLGTRSAGMGAADEQQEQKRPSAVKYNSKQKTPRYKL